MIAVAGAGIVGVTTALMLATRGHHVILIDKAAGAATATSFQNGAQLSYHYTDALASPTLLKAMPKLAMGADAAFRLRTAPNTQNLRWLLSFLRNCTTDRNTANSLAVMGLAQLSHAQMDRWIAELKPEFSWRRCGKLELYGDAASLAAKEKSLRLKNWFGAQQQVLDRKAILALDPALEEFRGTIAGGIYCPGEEIGDARLFAEALVAHLGTLPHVDIRFQTEIEAPVVKAGRVSGLRTSSGVIEADECVFTLGLWSRDMARAWGEHLPIIAMAGYSLDYAANNHLPEVALTDIASKVAFARVGSRARVAGFADLGYDSAEKLKPRLDGFRNNLKSRFGDMANGSDEAEVWLGHRPMTPDTRPIIRKAKVDGAWFNCGHGMLGWTLAAGSAVVLADMMEEAA